MIRIIAQDSRSISPVLGIVGMLVLPLLLIGPQDSRAQQWFQTASLVTPIEEEGPMRTLMDTLKHTIEERDVQVRRAPNQEQRSLWALHDSLVAEHGIGIPSANVVFIDYRLEYSPNNEYKETIKSFHFYFRGGSVREDVPLLYVDAQQDWVQELLSESKNRLSPNEPVFTSFHEQFEFLRVALREGTRIVEIGDETLREGFSAKKRALIKRVHYLMYRGLGPAPVRKESRTNHRSH